MKWREKEELMQPGGALEGKLDLLVSLDFRMAGNALYSDIVLPTATWYEKTDLSSTDMHPFVHPFQPAVDPLWESRTDWDIYRTLAKAVSEVAKEAHLAPYTNIAANSPFLSWFNFSTSADCKAMVTSSLRKKLPMAACSSFLGKYRCIS